MTKNDSEDSDLDDIGTFAEANRRRKDRIAELREGDKSDRRLAEVLAECRKGKRCGGDECPVCLRRIRLMEQRISSAVESTYWSDTPYYQVRTIRIEAIEVTGGRRPLDEEKVDAILASMKQIGLRTPITVDERKKKLVLVSGLHRLEAARRLGWDAIPCFVCFGDADTRPLEIAENLYRAELTALERAEHIDELRVLVQQKLKEAQDAPPGGRQPKDTGIKKAARALGLTKDEVRRAKKIAAISQKARAEAKKLGLDDNQRALLKVARLPTLEAQLSALREIDDRTRQPRAHRAQAVPVTRTDDKAAAGTETSLSQAADNAKTLKSETIDRAPAGGREQTTADATTTTNTATASTDDLGIPPFLDRRPLPPEDTASLAALTAAWEAASALKLAWATASTRAREQFIDTILRR